MTDAERLARTMWPDNVPQPTNAARLAQRVIDAGWTPPPPTLAEAVAAYRDVWKRYYGFGSLILEEARQAMFDALDREQDA